MIVVKTVRGDRGDCACHSAMYRYGGTRQCPGCEGTTDARNLIKAMSNYSVVIMQCDEKATEAKPSSHSIHLLYIRISLLAFRLVIILMFFA